MNRSRSKILIFFSKSVALSRITRLLFDFASHYSISIALRCASTIIYTFVACYTFNYTFVDNYSFFATTFSSLVSFCIVYASTKCCSSSSSSSNSSMHTESINVAPSHICSLTHQHCLLLHKNSIANVLIISCLELLFVQTIFSSLYAFLSTHSKDDECDNNLTTND